MNDIVFLENIRIPYLKSIHVQNLNKRSLFGKRKITLKCRITYDNHKEIQEKLEWINNIQKLQILSILNKELNSQNIYKVRMEKDPTILPIKMYDKARWIFIELIEEEIQSWNFIKSVGINYIQIRINDSTITSYEIAKVYYEDINIGRLIQYLNRNQEKFIWTLPIGPVESMIHKYKDGDTFSSLSKEYYGTIEYDFLIRKENKHCSFLEESDIYIPALIKKEAPIFQKVR